MTPTFHSIAYAGLEIANPTTLDAVRALIELTGLGNDGIALDIGAGAGGVSLVLAREFGLSVKAIERYDDMAMMIRERGAAAGVADRIEVIAEDSATALARLAPADLIVALGTTEPVGPGVRSAPEVFARLSQRLTSPGWLLWGDLTWKGEPPEPLRRIIGATGDYASHEQWLKAAETSGLEVVSAEIASDADWEAYLGGADARVRAWLETHPEHPAAEAIRTRADRVKTMFDFGRPWLDFGLYLFRKP